MKIKEAIKICEEYGWEVSKTRQGIWQLEKIIKFDTKDLIIYANKIKGDKGKNVK